MESIFSMFAYNEMHSACKIYISLHIHPKRCRNMGLSFCTRLYYLYSIAAGTSPLLRAIRVSELASRVSTSYSHQQETSLFCNHFQVFPSGTKGLLSSAFWPGCRASFTFSYCGTTPVGVYVCWT